jgi:hypothetical protein
VELLVPLLVLVDMTSVFSTIELPHWLMIAGAILLLLGALGLALSRRSVEAESDEAASERDLFTPPAYESPEEFYNLVAKEKPKDRSAEEVEDPAEMLLRLAGSESTSRN